MSTDARPAAATTVATAAAEWLKLRSVRSTWWFVGGAAAVMLLATSLEVDDGDPVALQSLGTATMTVVNFVQYILLALGILAMTNEFANRSITVTVMGTPSRVRVMLAKALVVGGVVFAVGTAVVAARRRSLGAPVRRARTAPMRRALGQVLAMGGYLAADRGDRARPRHRRPPYGRDAGHPGAAPAGDAGDPRAGRRAGSMPPGSATIADYTPGPAGFRFIAGEWEWGLVLGGWARPRWPTGVWALRRRDV